MTAPTPENDSARIEWLRQSRILDTPPESHFDDITHMAAQLFGAPIAGISLIDEERQWFKSILGSNVREIPRHAAFCAHTILRPEPLIVPDTAEDERFAGNPLVTGDLEVRFYAGAPLVTTDGLAVGSICVMDRKPRQLLSQEAALLEMLARQVMGRIEMQHQLALQASLLAENSQSQEALRRSEEGYRSLFLNAAEGIFQTTLEGRYRKVNPALARIYGYDSPDQMIEELTDLEHQLYVQPERRSTFQALMQEKGSVVAFESEVYRRDGSRIWISESARSVTDDDGKLCWYEGFVEDISERKTIDALRERALRDAQDQADRDPLTGLLNHRAFQHRLEHEAQCARDNGTSLAIVMLDIDGFEFFNDVYGHIVGDCVLQMVARRLQQVCRPCDTISRFGGDEFAVILPCVSRATASEIEAQMRSDLSSLIYQHLAEGLRVPITVSVGAALLTCTSMERHDALRLADGRLRRAKTGGQIENEADHLRLSMNGVEGFTMLDALVTAVDNKDRYTRRHSEDVMLYSLMIADSLGLDARTRRTVAIAALLHDVGKIGVPDNILRKPGKLTDEEYEVVMQHPQMGAAIVGAVPELIDTLDAVKHHHERWDGQGYPSRLRGKEIPLIARLMAVADAYSAMTTDRPYREGMHRDKALSILEAGAGTQWDPQCVAMFAKAMRPERRFSLAA